MATVRTAMGSRVRRVVADRWRVVTGDIWLLVQQTAAATVAWRIARYIGDHDDPFFAPISAVVSLNTSLGERGLNAVRLLQGVVVGIVVGELALLLIGGGYGTLALATFLALVIARALGGARTVLAQAAIAAILTVAVADGEVGYDRLLDALVGTGVALVFSQALFSPDPLRLLRRVESDALGAMAAGLELTARALDGDEQSADDAIAGQRALRDHLSELARMRRASTRVARHSLVWRGRVAPVVRETEDAGHLDLLGGSCLLLTRTTLALDDADRRALSECVRQLSSTLSDLAGEPGDRTTRQRAADRALEILRGMRAARAEPAGDLTAALTAARIAVVDLLLFVGVDPSVARAATRLEADSRHELEVTGASSPARPRFARLRRWARRRRTEQRG